MKISKITAMIAAILLVAACVMPWVQLPNGAVITGLHTEGTRFGKPAFAHFILTAVIILFTILPGIGFKRFNLIFGALNLAWAIKNFLIISRCEGGECPAKQAGLYLLLIASIVLMGTILFPQVDISKKTAQG